MGHYDREIKHGDIKPRTNRHICNIEQLCWLYEQTGERRYLDEARRIMDDSKQIPLYSRSDYTAYNAHGVTFMEKAKTPAACCRQRAANGRSCAAYVRQYYLQCRGEQP